MRELAPRGQRHARTWNHGTYPQSFFLISVHSSIQLLSQEEFASVEKIKIIGSTYMAACGLSPGGQESSSADDLRDDESDEESPGVTDDHTANATTMAKGRHTHMSSSFFLFLTPPFV